MAEAQCSSGDVRARTSCLLEKKLHTDCTFWFEKQGREVSGHTLIIRLASPVFEEMLTGAAGKRIPITDVEPDIFELLFAYIYTDEVKLNSTDTAVDLWEAARLYKITNLQTICRDYVTNHLSSSNVLGVYDFVLANDNDEDLKKKCEMIIRTETKAILEDCSFVNACPEVVEKVFSFEGLAIDNEMELFKALDRYSKHQKTEDEDVLVCVDFNSALIRFLSLTPTDNEMELFKAPDRYSKHQRTEDEDVCAYINSALEKIRFLSLTPDQFSAGLKDTTLLSGSQTSAILANLVSRESGVPMPTGFSVSREPRRKVIKHINDYYPLVTEVKFMLIINNFADIKQNVDVFSENIEIYNTSWKLNVTPKHFNDNKEYTHIYICSDKSQKDDCFFYVDGLIKLIKHDVTGSTATEMSITRTFTKEATCWGYNNYLERNEILDPKNYYIIDGAVVFEVHLKIKKSARLGSSNDELDDDDDDDDDDSSS